jgi:hypothetical protein
MHTINVGELRGKRWAHPVICDGYNVAGSRHNTVTPPKSGAEFVLRVEELQSRPTTDVIFSLKFLILFYARARSSMVLWQHL